MLLPNAEQAVIPLEKIKDYLLSSSQPVGRFKAAFFQRLGYTSEHWRLLEADIRTILTNEAKMGERNKYGQKFEVSGLVTGPAQKSARLVTAWIILTGESIPRFITAYPGDPK